MSRLAELIAVLLLVGIGTAGDGQPSAAPGPREAAKEPNGDVGKDAAAGVKMRVVVGYFLKTSTIAFVDGTKRLAVEVLWVRDDGNLDLQGVAYILAENAFVFPEGAASERLNWSGLKPGTRLYLYCTVVEKDRADATRVLKVGVPAPARPSLRGANAPQKGTSR